MEKLDDGGVKIRVTLVEGTSIELKMAGAAALAFANDRQFPADQLDHINGKPDSETVTLPGSNPRLASLTWRSEEKGKAWFVTVRISQSATGADIVTVGRSDLAKPYKHLETARTAALAIAKAQKFPDDKLREIQGVPLSKVSYTPSIGKGYTAYQWLSNGKGGGWYVHVRIDNGSGKVTMRSGGFSDE